MYTKTDFGENGRYYARPAAVNSNIMKSGLGKSIQDFEEIEDET